MVTTQQVTDFVTKQLSENTEKLDNESLSQLDKIEYLSINKGLYMVLKFIHTPCR
jgi:hypothetical protein